MRVQLRSTKSLRPSPHNPRINQHAVDAVAKSIKEFGFRQPIVVDRDGTIIVGHTRWKAAKKLRLAKVPVHVAMDLSAKQIKAYRIADNQTASLAKWDLDILSVELADLQNADYNLDVLGFGDKDLAEHLQNFDTDLEDAGADSAEPGGTISCPKCGHEFPKG